MDGEKAQGMAGQAIDVLGGIFGPEGEASRKEQSKSNTPNFMEDVDAAPATEPEGSEQPDFTDFFTGTAATKEVHKAQSIKEPVVEDSDEKKSGGSTIQPSVVLDDDDDSDDDDNWFKTPMLAPKEERGKGNAVITSTSRGGGKVKEDFHRKEKLIKAMVANSPPFLKDLKPYLEKATPILAAIASFLDIAVPVIVQYVTLIVTKFNELPEEISYGILGLFFCFFGGVYPVLILAVETFTMCGFEDAKKAIVQLYRQFSSLHGKVMADDNKDEDGDGVKDVDEISGSENFMRKLDIFVLTVKPEKLMSSLGTIYSGDLISSKSHLKLQVLKTFLFYKLGLQFLLFCKFNLQRLLPSELQLVTYLKRLLGVL
mmetsp:Transcript_5703/g.7593  ORF Transcript_5703/g.7593 Transcript_5703/m.7593 type:complete len:371 (-) Transcript_5703:548-1660(-)